MGHPSASYFQAAEDHKALKQLVVRYSPEKKKKSLEDQIAALERQIAGEADEEEETPPDIVLEKLVTRNPNITVCDRYSINPICLPPMKKRARSDDNTDPSLDTKRASRSVN
jgi:hypothetical protein